MEDPQLYTTLPPVEEQANPLLHPSISNTVANRIRLRRGDVVLVKATVSYDECDGQVFLASVTSCPVDEAVLQSRRFSPGETVRSINQHVGEIHGDGKVIAVHGDNVWVDFGNTQLIIRSTHLYVPEAE